MLMQNVEQFYGSGFLGLANAIIVQAIKDYQSALKKLQKNAKDKDAKYIIKDIKRFFHSEWYRSLGTFDGDYIIEMIEQGFKEKQEKRKSL